MDAAPVHVLSTLIVTLPVFGVGATIVVVSIPLAKVAPAEIVMVIS